ncbi:hypothetical protein C453_16673 [Haloferax elongans ATCC BAA-1513]|uniref:Uncharacterized protein n=1 Tax=Haloferax elongans ATCC BAA-1513 TaxID=1230453 RepID=M0HG10_HALEO|nr:hypothetical protein [Haloferax elongans]ELZ82738.1 hypothetical protein C453_16673 [Haloferax elongans ATCC BAA-1513]
MSDHYDYRMCCSVSNRWDALLPVSLPYSVVWYDETVPPGDEGFATKLREVATPCEAPDEWQYEHEEVVVYDEGGKMIKRTGGPLMPPILA